jgi:hypothetical protein
MHQTIIEMEEKERKIRKIKEFYCRNPDAPMPVPSIDNSNLLLKDIIGHNGHSDNPSPQMPGRDKTVSQKTGGNGSLVSFPSQNRNDDPQSIQPVPLNYDYNKIMVILLLLKMISTSGVTGDLKDAYATDGLLSYLEERQRRLDKYSL